VLGEEFSLRKKTTKATDFQEEDCNASLHDKIGFSADCPAAEFARAGAARCDYYSYRRRT
jgi:hypothetical protein